MRAKIMVHQYLQLPAELNERLNLSFSDDKTLLTETEETSAVGRSSLPSLRNTINSSDRVAAGTAQSLTPNKPAESHQPMGARQSLRDHQPLGSDRLVESNQAVERTQHQHSTPKAQSTETRARRANIFKNWWMEMGACFLFLTALVAVIATLYPHQGKPLPQWPFQMSVNTLLSMYLVVLKGTVLLVTAEGLGQLKWKWLQNKRPLEDLVKYDQATRGPLGALTLCRLRLRHPLSSAGALITLFILAVDPFTQQVIHYYNCSVPIDGLQATMPRTNIYLQQDSNQSFAMNEWIGSGLQAAINNGIMFPKGLVIPGCLTGNCTFNKEYGTVGYCSSCTDVTKDLAIRSAIVESNYTSLSENELINSNGTETRTNSTNPGYMGNTNRSISTSLPSGLSVSTNPGTNFNLTAMRTFQQPDGSEDLYRVEIIVGRQFQLLDTATGQPPAGCNTAATNDTWRCRGYGAASCSLSPCVRTCTSTIEAGVLHETRVSTSNNIRSSWGKPPLPSLVPLIPVQMHNTYLAMVDTLCLSVYERRGLLNAGYHLGSSTRWLAYNLTFDPQSQILSSNASFPEPMLINECIYGIDSVIVLTLWDAYLKDLFQGTVEGDAGNSGAIEVLRGSQILQTIYNYGEVSFDRVDSTFQNISDFMTSFFRQNSLPKYSDPAKGMVMHDRTCLSVRWAWLAFPSTLVLLALGFLVTVIIDTRPIGNRAPIWKSSPLALVFHGLELANKHQTDVGDINDMEKLAKDTIIRLGTTENGLNFVESENQHIQKK